MLLPTPVWMKSSSEVYLMFVSFSRKIVPRGEPHDKLINPVRRKQRRRNFRKINRLGIFLLFKKIEFYLMDLEKQQVKLVKQEI